MSFYKWAIFLVNQLLLLVSLKKHGLQNNTAWTPVCQWQGCPESLGEVLSLLQLCASPSQGSSARCAVCFENGCLLQASTAFQPSLHHCCLRCRKLDLPDQGHPSKAQSVGRGTGVGSRAAGCASCTQRPVLPPAIPGISEGMFLCTPCLYCLSERKLHISGYDAPNTQRCYVMSASKSQCNAMNN